MNLPRRSVGHQANRTRELVLLRRFGHREGIGHGLFLRQSAAGRSAVGRLRRSPEARVGADSADRGGAAHAQRRPPAVARVPAQPGALAAQRPAPRDAGADGRRDRGAGHQQWGAAARPPLPPPGWAQPGAAPDPARGPCPRHARGAERGARADRAGRGPGDRGRRAGAREDHHAGGPGRGFHLAAPLPRPDNRRPGRVPAEKSTRGGRAAGGRNRRPFGGGGAPVGEPARCRPPGRRRAERP